MAGRVTDPSARLDSASFWRHSLKPLGATVGKEDSVNKSPNDIGGQPAGPVNPEPHEPADWEKRLTAMVACLGPAQRGVILIDEFRRTRESIPVDLYNNLTYFELWTQGIANLLVEKHIISHADIDVRMSEIKDR